MHFLEDQALPAKQFSNLECKGDRITPISEHSLVIDVVMDHILLKSTWFVNYKAEEYVSKVQRNKQGWRKVHTLHDEKNTGCCSLVSKAGMMTDVRDVLKCGSPLMYFSRILSRPLDLYFGPLRALKFNRVSLNSPLSNNQKPNSTWISSWIAEFYDTWFLHTISKDWIFSW